MKLEKTGQILQAHGAAESAQVRGPRAAWVLAAGSISLGCTTVAVLGLMERPFSLFALRVFMLNGHHLS